MSASNDIQSKYLGEFPIGPLLLMPLKGTMAFTQKINDFILEWRKLLVQNKVYDVFADDFVKESYILKPEIDRFGSGEAKCVINGTIRGADIFVIVDVVNYSETYNMFGFENHMSPDDHYQDLKRVIAAANGKAKRINVIMPFLYESRQHKRTKRESLDCAVMLQELTSLGVSNILTIDAHDPRVMNAIPLSSFDSLSCYYQFVNAILNKYDDIIINKDNLAIISPDIGAMQRNIYFANVLGVDLGFFYKRRDYSRIVDGKNPIVAHEYMGADVEGKDIIVIDDMIASGDSLIETAKSIKERKAKRIFACCTFGLFTKGLSLFDKAYEEGIIDGIFTTNSIYQRPELVDKKWYTSVDVTEYVARIIESINHDSSISQYLDPYEKIKTRVKQYCNTKK
ncbi:MAG: ribose-phosphate pyrophosphokinase [Lachnospiraceae bacterium]|nr:ribose-phosphate pyrophosphokinase [Lachnospiraceae bacterium]